jgi:hypothetical protein
LVVTASQYLNLDERQSKNLEAVAIIYKEVEDIYYSASIIGIRSQLKQQDVG